MHLLFYYTLNAYRQNITNSAKLQGLDPNKNYEVKEINLEQKAGGSRTSQFSGDYLMKVGINVRSIRGDLSSNVYEISAVE